MAVLLIPNQVDSDPISVKEKVVRQIDCPNPECDASLDITNVNTGIKIGCASCNNVTLVPDSGNINIKKTIGYIMGLILSFIIGFLSSMAANLFTSVS
jgi:hypothetical protein